MIHFPVRRLAAAFAAGIVAVSAHADDSLLQLKGFGTLGATRTSDAQSGYRMTPQPASAARGDKWSVANDSLLGVQLDLAPKNALSATVQVIARHRNEGDLEAEVEWAYARWQIDPRWRLRVGRVLTPALMESDYRYVGYANVFLRPDTGIYPMYPLSTHDGLDLNYNASLGGGILNATVYGGKARLDGPDGTTFRASRLVGVALNYELDGLTVRAAHTDTNMKLTGPGTLMFQQFLGAAQQSVGMGCTSCANAVRSVGNGLVDTGYAVSSIGMRWVNDAWTLWGEAARTSYNEVLTGSEQALLLGVSRNSGDWTPYATYSSNRVYDKNAQKIAATDIARIPVPALRGLMNVYNEGIFPRDSGRKVLALGSRYDLMKNLALFGEVASVHINDPLASNLPFPRLTPSGTPRNKHFALYSISASFVF